VPCSHAGGLPELLDVVLRDERDHRVRRDPHVERREPGVEAERPAGLRSPCFWGLRPLKTKLLGASPSKMGEAPKSINFFNGRSPKKHQF